MKTKVIVIYVMLSAVAGASWRGVQVAYVRLAQIRGGAAGRIVTDNGTTAQWVSMSGDASILSGGGVTVSKINGNSVKAGTPSNNDVLTYVAANTRWEPVASTGLPAGTTGQTLRMNGTVPTWSSVLTNDGAGVGVTGASSTDALTLSAAGAFAINATSNQTNMVNLLSSVAGGASGGAAIRLGSMTTPSSGDRMGLITFMGQVSGTYSGQAFIQGVAQESWSAGAKGTSLLFSTTAVGSTSSSVRLKIHADGDIFLNAAASALATSATKGFTHLPNMAGLPTGIPGNTATGNTPIVYDTTSNRLMAYNSGWVNVANTLATSLLASGGGATASSIASTIDVVFVDTSAGGVYTATLPAAAARTGKPITVRRLTGGLANVVISRAGSDTVEGGTNVTLTSTSSITLIPNGVDWVTLSRSAN